MSSNHTLELKLTRINDSSEVVDLLSIFNQIKSTLYANGSGSASGTRSAKAGVLSAISNIAQAARINW